MERWREGETYKIKLKDGSIYTATITGVTGKKIWFTDRGGVERMVDEDAVVEMNHIPKNEGDARGRTQS